MSNERRPKAPHESATTKPSVTAGTDFVPVEPSAWLRSAAAARVRQIKATVPNVEAYGVVIAPLGETGPKGSREDRSCDRCRTYVPQNAHLHLLTYHVTPKILLCAGFCSVCASKEGTR